MRVRTLNRKEERRRRGGREEERRGRRRRRERRRGRKMERSWSSKRRQRTIMKRKRKLLPKAQDLLGLHSGGCNGQGTVYMVELLTTVKGLGATMSSGSYLHRDSNQCRSLNMLVDLWTFLYTNNINALKYTTPKYC
jgi:hypothetical protein